MPKITIENETLRLEFDRATGALVGLTALPTGWKILDRPHLGLSFRMLLPIPDRANGGRGASGRRNNPVYGENQQVVEAVVSGGNHIRFVWDHLQSEHGGVHNICVTLDVALNQRQAVFAMTIDNKSDCIIENVYCPYLGDVRHPSDEEWFETFRYHYASAQQMSLWPTFQNTRGYYGFDFPQQVGVASHSAAAPMAPFILLRGARQGLYAGVASSSTETVAWHCELRPGYGSSIDARAPLEDTIGGTDVATRFAAIHLPYVQPGETRALTPVAIEAYQGGWQAGVDIYKRWRDTWFATPRIPAWAQQPHSWQQIHINSPEEEWRVGFRDLVKVGEECTRYGVAAIQLVGWNDGGQDRGNPAHDPDPHLGTFEDLKWAIRQIQALGVKVVLFAKFTWADRHTERFRSDLIRLAIKDPWGDIYQHPGYQYQTATQMLDVNTRRLIPMCFQSEEYLKVCEDEFQKALDLGADGILFDECLHHSPTLACFDMTHGHRYGASTYANDRLLIHRFARLSGPVNRDFLYAGEACYDWELDSYHLSYHRSESKEHVPLSRYMLPHAPLMTAVTGFNDRNMINQCLMYRYIISYEPYNFKGRLGDFPLTTAYGRQMDALRTELRAYFWDGEFCDTVGATVTCDGKPHAPYAVFAEAQSGKLGLVVCNYDEKAPVTVAIALDNGQPLQRYRLVDDPSWQPVAGGISIPPCSAAVVI